MPIPSSADAKTLILLRHGKAEPISPDGDYGRKLTDRGRRDVQQVIERAKLEIGTPDLIVTSGAARAAETAAIAADILGYESDIVPDDSIYSADTSSLLEIVQALPAAIHTAMLVGHNPSFEALGAMLIGDEESLIQMPTAGLLRIELATDSWDKGGLGGGILLGKFGPKG